LLHYLFEAVARQLHLQNPAVAFGKLAAQQHVHQLEASAVHQRIAPDLFRRRDCATLLDNSIP
jgi:hypothetical protein